MAKNFEITLKMLEDNMACGDALKMDGQGLYFIVC